MLSFRLWTIFYVFALLAAAMATFGASGLLVGVFIFVFWTTVSVSVSPRRTVLAWCVGICLVLATLAFFLPALSKAREAARRNQCFGQLKQLAVALQSHHNIKGVLPPAYIEAADGKRILGWRHMLLPFMEEQPLFNRIDQSKAWDDPANFPATATQLSRFHCPSCNLGPTTTEYVAAVGPQTAWPGATGRKFQDFSDGIANTILVIETHGRSVNWAAPSDLTFDEAVELLSKPVPANDGHEMYNGFFYKKSRGRSLMLADTSVKYITRPLDRELAAALLTVAGGEQVSLSELEKASKPQLDYAKCYSFGAFVTLALVPAVWMRRNATRAPTIGDV